MKKITRFAAAALIAAAATVGVLQLSATPAEAGPPGCMGECVSDIGSFKECSKICNAR